MNLVHVLLDLEHTAENGSVVNSIIRPNENLILGDHAHLLHSYILVIKSIYLICVFQLIDEKEPNI